MTYVEKQFSDVIKVIRSDNGSEFVNKDLTAWLSRGCAPNFMRLHASTKWLG